MKAEFVRHLVWAVALFVPALAAQHGFAQDASPCLDNDRHLRVQDFKAQRPSRHGRAREGDGGPHAQASGPLFHRFPPVRHDGPATDQEGLGRPGTAARGAPPRADRAIASEDDVRIFDQPKWNVRAWEARNGAPIP